MLMPDLLACAPACISTANLRQSAGALSANENNRISKGLACPSILDSISTGATPTTLINLGRTCSAVRTAVESFNSVAFNIDTFLSTLGLDPIPFRSMQQRTGSLIGGSTALSFFTRTQYLNDNINLFVQPGHAYEVARHLIDVQGFSYRPPGSRGARDFVDGIADATPRSLKRRQRQDSVHTIHAIDRVHRFEKRIDRARVIELLVMQTSRSAVHAILNGHSTATMNILSYDCAVSLYPLSTFGVSENQELKWNMLDSPVDAYLGIIKYSDFGFSPRAYISKEYAREILHTDIERRIGDEFCWTIKFKTDNLDERVLLTPASPPVRANLLLNNSWHLVGSGSLFQMRYCIVSLPIFRYSYAVADDRKATAMRQFFDEQWPRELEARHLDNMHQTWWDGALQRVQAGDAVHVRYTDDDQDLKGWQSRYTEGNSWCGDSDKEDSASTISERSYFPIIPVLINARMTRKSTDEILHHFRTALENDVEEADASLSDEEFEDM
ncbi:hypothetical protein HWV62_33303 [Athelia sp. TMB]|nr:hypothetical protein HWV62_33303 [Athelia sp. TMB]